MARLSREGCLREQVSPNGSVQAMISISPGTGASEQLEKSLLAAEDIEWLSAE